MKNFALRALLLKQILERVFAELCLTTALKLSMPVKCQTPAQHVIYTFDRVLTQSKSLMKSKMTCSIKPGDLTLTQGYPVRLLFQKMI